MAHMKSPVPGHHSEAPHARAPKEAPRWSRQTRANLQNRKRGQGGQHNFKPCPSCPSPEGMGHGPCLFFGLFLRRADSCLRRHATAKEALGGRASTASFFHTEGSRGLGDASLHKYVHVWPTVLAWRATEGFSRSHTEKRRAQNPYTGGISLRFLGPPECHSAATFSLTESYALLMEIPSGR